MRVNLCCMWLALMLAASSVLAVNPRQDGNAGTPPDEPGGGAEAEPSDVKIRFSFKDATLEQVLDFFSRESGLPIVREAAVPDESLTYVSLREYDLPEALRVLNIILQARGIMLRVSDDMLYLQQLSEMMKEDLKIYQGTIPEEVTNDQIVITVVPLLNALAPPLAEKLKEMVGAYGSVFPMEAQNSLVITETAGKIRQLQRIIAELDREDPQGLIRIFKVSHTKASALMEPLKALMAEKVQKIIINPQNNKQTVVEEVAIRGLTISHDDRTNVIIAKGIQSKIAQLEEVLELLDVPDAGRQRTVRTFSLATLAPSDASAKLKQLYQKLPAEEQPTIMTFEDVGKLTIIGSDAAILEAMNLLKEIDGGGQATPTDHAITVIPVTHAEPGSLISALKSLLNRRQAVTLKMVAGRDGNSIVVSGPGNDVDTVRAIVPIFDTPARINRDVRLMTITAADPDAMLTRARALYDQQVDPDDPAAEFTLDFDPASRTATLIGDAAALDKFSSVLRLVESNTVVERETRQMQLESARPSAIIAALTPLANSLLQPRDGSTYSAPEYEALDQLDLLLVTATPAQFSVIESLITTLDEPDPGEFQFRVVKIGDVTDVTSLLARTQFVFERRTRGRDPDEISLPEVEHDELTGNLLVTGDSDSIAIYEQSLAEARNLLPPAREGRLVDLTFAKAGDVVARLTELLQTLTPTVSARQVLPPEIRVVELTNSLYVVAEPAQHAMVDRFVRELDKLEPTDLPPLRLIQVRAADAVQIAGLLRQRYDARPLEQKREQPVTIDSDAATNALIVTAADALYEDIRAFIEDINTEETGAERTTKIYPLKLARATDLAAALEKLYPEPPMPMDTRRRPLPHLQKPREVLVSADQNTNSLIVDMPVERITAFDALVDQLDRVELPPRAELRTYFVETGDLDLLVQTLNKLKDVIVDVPEDGSKPVQVMIQGEPRSRTLIVAGDEVTFAKVEELLLTIRPIPAQRELTVIDVEQGDPQDLADRALALYSEQTEGRPDTGEVSVEVDRDNATMLVVADAEAMITFVSIVNTLQQSFGPPADVRLITIEFADASDVVEYLTDLGDSARSVLGRRVGPEPTYAVIERINSILVSAPSSLFPVLEGLIENLDVPESQDMPPIRILQLRTADAGNLASALMAQYNMRPPEERQLKPITITADPNTNSLVIAAHPEMMAEIQTIVTELNDTNRMDSEGREISIFPLKVARAEELAKTIDEMYPEPPMPLDPRTRRPRPDLQQPREVVVRADPQTNSLIVDAPIQRMAGFQRLVEQLDRAQILEETEIRTYRIVHADLDSLANTFQQMATSGILLGNAQDRRAPITISTEPVSQSLVVSGPAAIFERVEKTLLALDARQIGPATSMRFFSLKSARAESLAPMLREILVMRIAEDIPEAGANAESLLNVTSDRKTNTLIISAPDEIMPVVEQLIEQLDGATVAIEDPVIKVLPLTFADASVIAQDLSRAIGQTISKVTGEPMEVEMIASPGSNALILVGIPQDVAEVEKLIEPLDQRPAMDALDAETYPLEYADAQQIAPVLERLLTNQLATDPRIIAQQLRARRGEIDTTPKIQVDADERTNSIIVSGTQQTVALAETLIKKLDMPDDSSNRIVETYTPHNADSDQLVDSVQRVMASSRPTGRRSTIELIAEPQSGTIVVIGMQEETEQAIALLSKWDDDALVAPQMDLQIIHLQHTEAAVVAQTITPMLQDQSRWPARLRNAAKAGLALSQPNVTADTSVNRVLVTAPGELMQVARDLIAQLDQPRAGDDVIDVRIFNLTQADATDVATAITAATAHPGRPGDTPVTVTAEPSSNSIVVAGTERQLEEVDTIVASLDRGIDISQSQIKTIFLKHARAENVSPIVEKLLADEETLDVNTLPNWARVQYLQAREQMGAVDVRVTADTRLNAVVIAAPPGVLKIAGELVAQLDVDPGADPAGMRTVHVLTVDNADAAELAITLDAIFSDADQPEAPPTIRVDASSSSLIIRATEQQFRMIESVTRDIDRASITTSRKIQSISIDPSRASAAEVAQTLERLLNRRGVSTVEVIPLEELFERRMKEQEAAEDEDSGRTSMRWDSPLNAIARLALAIPPQEDIPYEPAPDDSSTEAGPGDEPPDQDDPEENLPESTDAISDAAEAPSAPSETAPSDPAPKDEVLELAAPSDLAPGEEEAEIPVASDPASAEGESALPIASTIQDEDDEADVTIAVDPKTNSLIVIGSPRAVDRIEALALEIQDQLPPMPGTIRYIPLPETIDAQALAQIVGQTMRRLVPAGGERGALLQRVSVIPDVANNALVVAANDVDFETVADLILALSRPGIADEVVVKVYPLTTITAERAAESVRGLISRDAGGGGRRGGRNRQAQRMRELTIVLLHGEREIEAVFDPNQISVSTDSHSNALIVMGPAEAIEFIDQFVEIIDQSPVNAQATLKMFSLRHAQASELLRTLRSIFQVRYSNAQSRDGREALEPEFGADERTNTLIVTASPEDLSEVGRLLEQLDIQTGEERHALRMIELVHAEPGAAAEILNRVVIGNDQELKKNTMIVPYEEGGVLLVRGTDEVMADIDRVLAEIDRDTSAAFEPRSITLERASAAAVADTIQRFYDDRAKLSGDRRAVRRVSVIGDESSNTLLIAASDEDFETVRGLVEMFDSAEASKELEFKVFQLEHAQAQDIQDAVQQMVNELTWNQGFMFFDPWGFGGRGGGRGQQDRGTLTVRGDTRLNALIVIGEGDKFELVSEVVKVLDAPVSESEQRIVKVYPIRRSDPDVVTEVINSTFLSARQLMNRRWMPPGAMAGEVNVFLDERARSLIITASTRQHEEIGALLQQLEGGIVAQDQEVAVIAVEWAEVGEIAESLERFLDRRAEASHAPEPTAAIIPVETTNMLIISADATDMATIRDMLSRIDVDDISGDRTVEIVALRDADPDEVVRILNEQFDSRGSQGLRVTPDARTNSLIVNAPRRQFASIMALIELLDTRDAGDVTILRTYVLDDARAETVVDILTQVLDLDASGVTTGKTIKIDERDEEGVEVKATVVADARSNSLIITMTPESVPVMEKLISELDEAPVKQPVEWKIIKLNHALAYDTSFTLRRFLSGMEGEDPEPRIDYNEPENQLIIAATQAQFGQIEKLLSEIDVPSDRKRRTEFVPLQFAKAESVREAMSYFYGPFVLDPERPTQLTTRVVANAAANGLLIIADEEEWPIIEAWLEKFDDEIYDSSLQLRVLPLKYADATSVARAINEAFQRPAAQRGGNQGDPNRQPRGDGQDEGERRDATPTVIIEVEEWVSASAEPLTNSIIVSASRPNFLKIEAILKELDVAEFTKLPPPRLIPVREGSPTELARSLNEVYQQPGGGRRPRAQTRRSVIITANEDARTIIVRSEDEEFEQIRTLAEALQQEFGREGLAVHIIRLTAAPASRVEAAIREAFQAKAEKSNTPLSIHADPAGNTLVIASSSALFAEIEETVKQLDALSPAAGQGIFIIELENIDPEKAKSVLETIGLDKEQDPDSVSRLVTEPIRVSVLAGRNALILIANPVDRETIVGILKAIDAEPAFAETRMRVVRLRNAKASAIKSLIEEILNPGDQQSSHALAQAVQEQVRRLSLRTGDGVRDPDLTLDLTQPIRVIADDGINALIIGSSPENVAALEQIVSSFDSLPVTEGVMVQMFPLDNIDAVDFQNIIAQLFAEGKRLGTAPGSEVTGVPKSVTGRVLADEIAMTVDERTNTLIVAGKEESIAFIEVMQQRLDSQVEIGWIEPRIVKLTFADANDLAATIDTILVEGSKDLPQSTPLQRQIGRLRMIRDGRQVESDVFQPMARMVVMADEEMNALILVGTPKNLVVVEELVAMLDIEARSREAKIRIYPVEFASASKIGATIERLIQGQVQSGAIRDEDGVVIATDERTNALIVSTSTRTFAIVESLLSKLDAEVSLADQEIRQIPIESASATHLAGLIQQLMDARLDRLREVQPETADLDKAMIVADPRTNSLLVAAGRDSYQMIRQLVDQLDTSTLGEAGLVNVIPAGEANLDRLAQTINTILDRRWADVPDEVRRAHQPLVMTDPRSNSLLVVANPEDVNTVRDLVSKLQEIPIDPAVGLHLLALDSTQRAEDLADRLQRLMDERIKTLDDAKTPMDEVTIEPYPATNSLLYTGSDENLRVVKNFIAVLKEHEETVTPGTRLEVIPLSLTSPAPYIVEVLREMHVDEENRKRGEDTIRISADERNNVVLVNAPEADIATIRDLVEQLDKTRPPTVVEIEAISLKSADPQEIVALIRDVISNRGLDGRQSNPLQSMIIRYIREIDGVEQGDDAAELEISTAVRNSINLTADQRSSKVIVSAPKDSMDLIRKLIRDLDEADAGNKVIETFRLANADAAAMKQILEDLFSVRSSGRNEVLRPVEDEVPGGDGLGGGSMFDTPLSQVPDERQQLSITVDSRTNTLIVSGTPRYLDLVAEVVKELDAEEANERITWVYPLKNAVAEDIATVVSDFVEKDQQKLLSTLDIDQVGNAGRILEREVTIVGDSKSNTILVSASPRYLDQVKDIITQLDVDPPQVLIQVLLAEVTLDSSDDWGVQLAVDGNVGDTSVSAGFGLFGPLLTGIGVPHLSIASTDLDLMIHALQSQGRIQVLSNPTIMAANNEEAFLQVGEEIRVASGSSFASGTSLTETEAKELGVILRVTPSINPDGFVRMAIQPSISSLSDRTVQINEDLSTPVILKREADTVVTVMDGQTVVLGGLISDRLERRQTKVPFFGDLPIIGALFRNERETTAKTELLIVLTPHVIMSPSEMRRTQMITDAEIDRLNVPQEVKDQIRRGAVGGTGGLYDADGNRLNYVGDSPPKKDDP